MLRAPCPRSRDPPTVSRVACVEPPLRVFHAPKGAAPDAQAGVRFVPARSWGPAVRGTHSGEAERSGRGGGGGGAGGGARRLRAARAAGRSLSPADPRRRRRAPSAALLQ